MRRTALDGQSTSRAERKTRTTGAAPWGFQVALALQERDAWVAQCEQRAGQVLTELVEAEGLSAGEAVRWCGPARSPSPMLLGCIYWPRTPAAT